MAYTLQPFKDWAAVRALPLDRITLRCHLVAEPTGQDTTVSGTLCDTYATGVRQVDLLVDGRPIGRLDATTEPVTAFENLVAAIKDEGQLPYAIPRLVTHGDPVPVAREPHEIGWTTLHERVQAQDDLLMSLLRQDTTGIHQAAFRKFSQSPAYAQHPCDAPFYQALREEFLASDFVTGMSFGDYYTWLHRSAERLTADGALNDATVAQIGTFLAHRTGDALDAHSYWMLRNLEVHPRHEPLFNAELQRQHERRTLEQVVQPVADDGRRPQPAR